MFGLAGGRLLATCGMREVISSHPLPPDEPPSQIQNISHAKSPFREAYMRTCVAFLSASVLVS
jgi:hypothetical protein